MTALRRGRAIVCAANAGLALLNVLTGVVWYQLDRPWPYWTTNAAVALFCGTVAVVGFRRLARGEG